MSKGGWVYIVTNKHHTVLYTGVTSDLVGRMLDHLQKDMHLLLQPGIMLRSLFITSYSIPWMKLSMKRKELRLAAEWLR